MTEDPRLAAARYRVDKLAHDVDEPGDNAEAAASVTQPRTSPTTEPRPGYTAQARAAYVETAIQQAIRRGEFDNLPGAGKPLPGLSDHHDPDWWIRRKIQTEKLSGLGPPALTLRVEHAELEDRLDELTREADVREYLDDFNRRVIEARRQLLGGPPVVTPTRDVDAEVRAWRDRQHARAVAAAAEEHATTDAASPRRHWWQRRSPQ